MLRHKGNKENNRNFLFDEVPYIGYQTDNIC